MHSKYRYEFKGGKGKNAVFYYLQLFNIGFLLDFKIAKYFIITQREKQKLNIKNKKGFVQRTTDFKFTNNFLFFGVII